jgi:hypothetical protein
MAGWSYKAALSHMPAKNTLTTDKAHLTFLIEAPTMTASGCEARDQRWGVKMRQEQNLKVGQVCGTVQCPHGKRLTEDCIHCLDLEEQVREDAEGFPVGTLRNGISAFRGGVL